MLAKQRINRFGILLGFNLCVTVITEAKEVKDIMKILFPKPMRVMIERKEKACMFGRNTIANSG